MYREHQQNHLPPQLVGGHEVGSEANEDKDEHEATGPEDHQADLDRAPHLARPRYSLAARGAAGFRREPLLSALQNIMTRILHTFRQKTKERTSLQKICLQSSMTGVLSTSKQMAHGRFSGSEFPYVESARSTSPNSKH